MIEIRYYCDMCKKWIRYDVRAMYFGSISADNRFTPDRYMQRHLCPECSDKLFDLVCDNYLSGDPEPDPEPAPKLEAEQEKNTEPEKEPEIKEVEQAEEKKENQEDQEQPEEEKQEEKNREEKAADEPEKKPEPVKEENKNHEKIEFKQFKTKKVIKLDMPKVLALRRAKWTIQNIAIEFGVSHQTVRNRLEEYYKEHPEVFDELEKDKK